jgi:NADH-quinone oxidoreductase subunit A
MSAREGCPGLIRLKTPADRRRAATTARPARLIDLQQVRRDRGRYARRRNWAPGRSAGTDVKNKRERRRAAPEHTEHMPAGSAGSPRMNPYVVFLLYLAAILGLVAIMLLLNAAFGPKPANSAVKLEPFECGATPVSTLNVKAVPIKYYAVAIVFLLFDLETVFLFIWALGAQPLTGWLLFTFLFFMALLVLIVLYVYKVRLIESVTE